jgi:translocation and assembly module TamB
VRAPGDPAARRPGWRSRFAVGAAGAALVTLAGAAWLFRLPIVDAAVRDALRRAEVDADFEVTAADFGGARLRAVRLGAANAPDAAAQSAEVGLAWGLLGPKIAQIRLVEPSLRVRIDRNGMSLGALGRLLAGSKGGGASQVPDMQLEIERGRVLFLTPVGAIPATVTARGRLTRDFQALAEIAPVNRPGEVEGLSARVAVRTEDRKTVIEAAGDMSALRSPGAAYRGLRLTGRAEIPPEVRGALARINLLGAELTQGETVVKGLRLEARLEPVPDERWRLSAVLQADSLTGPAIGIKAGDTSLTALGDLRQARGEWSARGADMRLGALAAPEVSASGVYALDGRAADGPVIAASGRLNMPQGSIDARGRDAILRAIPNMGGSPVSPLLRSGKSALDRALTRFSAAAAMQLDWRSGAGRLAVLGPLSLDAASGARLSVTPQAEGRPVLLALLPSGALEGAGRIDVDGGDLPPARLTLSRFSLNAGALNAEGAAAIADWRAADGRLELQPTTFALTRDARGGGKLSLDGALALDGRTEALSVKDFRAPLRLDASWGGGFRVVLPERCIPASFGALGLPGHALGGRNVSLCTGADNLLVGSDALGNLSGGFSVDKLALSGRTADRAGKPVTLETGRIEGRFIRDHLEIAAASPRYAIDFAPDRRIRFSGEMVTARTAAGGRVIGALSGGMLEDPALPANVTSIAANWSAAPEGGRTVIRIADGAARLTDKFTIPLPKDAAPDEKPRPRFNPLQIARVSGALSDGRISATGDILLEAGARRLAGFNAQHDLSNGSGEAHIQNEALLFTRRLDLFEITELARGTIEGVDGPVGVDLVVNWDGETLRSRGRISPRHINFIAAAIGPVEGLSGDVDFDDLFALHSLPGQRLAVRRLNPGVVVEAGEIRFQIEGPEHVIIEGAEWPFASGRLSIARQRVTIGDDNFSMLLNLTGVDVQQLLDQLAVKDLKATGTVEGSFPLEFTRAGGRIVDGELRAAAGGGTISYTGNAGQGLIGAPQIAFDALKAFAYKDLVLELYGPLDGEIVSDIRFTGENVQPIGGIVAPGAIPLPGMQRLTVTGWPFQFNVTVRAPFRQLARTSSGINDARPLVDEAIREQQEATPSPTGAVDPPPQTPR